jgi:DNA-binding response OmpR family regulator
LVVDDEPDICLVLKIVLEKAGFVVEYYDNPISVLDKFESNFYDLIILDIQMPGMNGMQVYRELRKRDSDVKICFLTAIESIFDIAHKFKPVYTFIKKPVENNDLIRIVNSLLKTNE